METPIAAQNSLSLQCLLSTDCGHTGQWTESRAPAAGTPRPSALTLPLAPRVVSAMRGGAAFQRAKSSLRLSQLFATLVDKSLALFQTSSQRVRGRYQFITSLGPVVIRHGKLPQYVGQTTFCRKS